MYTLLRARHTQTDDMIHFLEILPLLPRRLWRSAVQRVGGKKVEGIPSYGPSGVA